MNKKILIIENKEGYIKSSIKSIDKQYNVFFADNENQAIEIVEGKQPNLVIMDEELKNTDIITLYKKIKDIDAQILSIMVIDSNNTKMGVLAVRAGIDAVISKPIDLSKLPNLIKKYLEEHKANAEFKDIMWLKGSSREISNLQNALDKCLKSNKDIILIGGKGTLYDDVVNFIHDNGISKNKNIATMDLSLYENIKSEISFWTSLNNLMESSKNDSKKIGIVVFQNIENVPDSLAESLFEYLKNRKNIRQDVDIQIRTIVTLNSDKYLNKLKTDLTNDFEIIKIPNLTERREDILLLLDLYLEYFGNIYSKKISEKSQDIIDFFINYSWEGNISQFISVIEYAVMLSKNNKLDLINFPLSINMLIESEANKHLAQGSDYNSLLTNFNEKFNKIIYNKTRESDIII